jgi:transaldolase
MKIFLDTGNLDEIRQAASFGLLDGVTTNPTLAAREGRPFRELILEMCEIVKDGVVNAEVVSPDVEGMLREARELASWHPNIVVKLPMTPSGVRALNVLRGESIRVNVTLVFSPTQALLGL